MINIHTHVCTYKLHIYVKELALKFAWPGCTLVTTENSSKSNKVILNISFSLAYFIIESSLLLLCRLKNIIQCCMMYFVHKNIRSSERRMCISEVGKRTFIIYLWLTDIKLSEMEHFEMVMNSFCFSCTLIYVNVCQWIVATWTSQS